MIGTQSEYIFAVNFHQFNHLNKLSYDKYS
jgi:hypothetical protein